MSLTVKYIEKLLKRGNTLSASRLLFSRGLEPPIACSDFYINSSKRVLQKIASFKN